MLAENLTNIIYERSLTSTNQYIIVKWAAVSKIISCLQARYLLPELTKTVFSGGQSPKFFQNGESLNFPEKLRKIKISKITPYYQPPPTPSKIYLQTKFKHQQTFQGPRSIAFYVKINHFFCKVHFSLYLTIPSSRKSS